MKKRIVALIVAITCTVAPVQQTYAKDYLYADDVYTMAVEICDGHNISPELVQAIIWRESRYDADAVNSSCKGLMQINEPCHRDRMKKLGVTNLYNPYDNVKVGVDYLAELFTRYEDTAYVLDVYSGNRSAGANFKSGVVSKYAKGIMELAAELEKEHGK